jgi:hypothetical protein
MTHYNRFYRYNRWDPENIFRFPHRICDENAGRGAYCIYSAMMRAGDAPGCCEFGPGTPGFEMRTVNTEAPGCVRENARPGERNRADDTKIERR